MTIISNGIWNIIRAKRMHCARCAVWHSLVDLNWKSTWLCTPQSDTFEMFVAKRSNGSNNGRSIDESMPNRCPTIAPFVIQALCHLHHSNVILMLGNVTQEKPANDKTKRFTFFEVGKLLQSYRTIECELFPNSQINANTKFMSLQIRLNLILEYDWHFYVWVPEDECTRAQLKFGDTKTVIL